ncbi:MAG: alpha/beta fold hydrolase [Bacteriovoracia bacterium]
MRQPEMNHPDSASLAGSAAAPSATNGYFHSHDRVKLFYSVEGTGKPLIFCYGLICSSLHWSYQTPHFRKTHKTVWFDYRGHHNSETPKDIKTITIANTAKDLLKLMDELGLEQAVILGHSMGVNVALETARVARHRVAGLVLSNGTAKRPFENMFSRNWCETGIDYIRKAYRLSPKLASKLWRLQRDSALTHQIISFGGFNTNLTKREDIRKYIEGFLSVDLGIFLQVADDYHRYDATPWLHTIQTPTLILAGENDKMTPTVEQELLRQLMPNSQLEIIKHGSHCVQMDLPDLVNSRIRRFLKTISY